MAIWIRCKICGTEEYIDWIKTKGNPNNPRFKKRLFEMGFWDCCEFARRQHYERKPKLEFEVIKE